MSWEQTVEAPKLKCRVKETLLEEVANELSLKNEQTLVSQQENEISVRENII